jgi:hypothetical protein
MKIATFWSVLLLGVSVWSSSSRAETLARENFSQLSAQFNGGNVPGFSDLAGWLSGRCYSVAAQETPHNSLFVGWSEEDSFKGIYLNYHQGEPEDFFDNLPYSVEVEVADFIKVQKSVLESATVKNGSVVIGFNGVEAHIRKSKDRLITQIQEDGEIQSYCHSLKKVR